MNVAVIGLGFGDEGKGVVTDYISSLLPANNTLVVRFSGGHQSGHTVTKNGINHIFSNFGSGTLRNIPTYWSKHCTISPTGIYNEYQVLKTKNIEPELYIDKCCPVVTPYDIKCNQSSDIDVLNGTCGTGFGATINREEHFYRLQFLDLFYPFVFKTKLNAIKSFYKNITVDEEQLASFISHCNFVIAKYEPVVQQYMFNKYSNIIFEGSQGLLLDQDIGFFPHVTRSNTGSTRIHEFNPHYALVTRAYQTRHGNGPMTNEKLPHNIYKNPAETNICNKWQGEFRISLLDVDLLEYAISKDGIDPSNATLYVTCIDHIKNDYRFTRYNELVYCDNEQDFIHKISSILGIKNVVTIKIINNNVVISSK